MSAAEPETFNRLCASAFDFLLRSSSEIDTEPKHALVSFAAGMELILKARLLLEHWTLIVASKPNLKSFKKGDFHSVGTSEALARLNSIVGISVPKDAEEAFERVIEHRNRVVHFYHEFEGDRFRQIVAQDMCLGWLHLKARIEAWGRPFTRFDSNVAAVHASMRKVTAYLAAVYERVKPELELKARQGTQIATCPACLFQSAPVELVKPPISSQTCAVCSLTLNLVQVDCLECETPHRFSSWDHFQPIQCECGETVTQDDIRSALDESDPYDEQVINCGDCQSVGTVIRNGALYICIECAAFSEDVQFCGACGEGQLNGGPLDDSAFEGCELCDGAIGRND